MLNAISNGLITSNIQYQSLDYQITGLPTAVYTPGTTSVYPTLDVNGPTAVVSSITVPNGIGGTLTTNYTYAGLKVDLTGRGSLGFATVQATQVESGVQTVSSFRQDFPFTGSLSQEKTFLLPTSGASIQLSQTDNTYFCVDFSASGTCTVAAGKSYFVGMSQSTQQRWDIDVGHTALPSVTTAVNYDCNGSSSAGGRCNGNVMQEVRQTSDNYQTTTSYTYGAENPVAWLLGRATRKTETRVSP